MKKAFVFLLVLAIAISTVFASGANESADGGKKTITIGAESWEINKLFLEHAAEEFEAAHPDVEVEIVTIADQTKLANYILDWGRGTTDVDLVFLDGGIFSVEYASKGLIYDFEKDLDFFADFPKSKFTPGSLETGFIKGAKVFLVGRNLLTFTGYKGYDPEVNNTMTFGDYPNTRQYSIGAQLTF